MRIRPIIVNYNGHDDTIECLTSLYAQTCVRCDPLVIDNGSEPGSADRIRQAHPHVELRELGYNSGFCGGNNVGIEQALAEGYDYVFLVNNDTTMEPDCVHRLLECASANPQAAAVGPTIYYYSDKTAPWFAGSTVNMSTGVLRATTDDPAAKCLTKPYDVPWSTGCALLIPAEHARTIGGFDDRFFCYYEDVDWSFRARALGLKCLLCPPARLYHKIAATSGRTNPRTHYYNCRNQLLFFGKNFRGLDRHRLLARITARALKHGSIIYAKNRASDRKTAQTGQAMILGVLDYYRKRFGVCPYTWN